MCLRASDENKRERGRGLDSGVYYHLKRGDDSRAGRPVPANIRRERERERQKRFRHCTFLQSAAPGYSGCTPLPFSHFSLPPTPPSPPPLPLPPPPGSAAPFSGSNIDPDIFPSFFFPRPYERHFQQFFLSVGHPLSPPPNPTAASHVRTTLVPPPERSYISRSSVRASFIGHQRG